MEVATAGRTAPDFAISKGLDANRIGSKYEISFKYYLLLGPNYFNNRIILTKNYMKIQSVTPVFKQVTFISKVAIDVDFLLYY